jgi:hypothetical protein
MRKRTTILLMAVMLTSSVNATCSKESLLSNAQDVISSLRSAAPLIESLIPQSAGKLTTALTIAEKLRAAIQAGDTSNAVILLSDLVPTFQSIVNEDLAGLTAGQRTAILAALAVADIALHFLVRNLLEKAPPSAGPRLNRLQSFSQEPVWGEQFKKRK